MKNTLTKIYRFYLGSKTIYYDIPQIESEQVFEIAKNKTKESKNQSWLNKTVRFKYIYLYEKRDTKIIVTRLNKDYANDVSATIELIDIAGNSPKMKVTYYLSILIPVVFSLFGIGFSVAYLNNLSVQWWIGPALIMFAPLSNNLIFIQNRHHIMSDISKTFNLTTNKQK